MKKRLRHCMLFFREAEMFQDSKTPDFRLLPQDFANRFHFWHPCPIASISQSLPL